MLVRLIIAFGCEDLLNRYCSKCSLMLIACWCLIAGVGWRAMGLSVVSRRRLIASFDGRFCQLWSCGLVRRHLRPLVKLSNGPPRQLRSIRSAML